MSCAASCGPRACRAACTSVAMTAARTIEAVDVGKSAADILGEVLPEVFDRFKEAAAKTADVKKGADALFTAENLQGLPSVFGSLGPLRDEKGKTVFRVESGPLKEVLDRIEERANYGDTASGRFLADEFAKEPFGWDFEAVRLLVLSLLRAGKIEATSKGQTIDVRDRGRSARHLLEQQLIPPGVVPAEEGHRVRRTGEGFRGLPRHVRKRSPGAERCARSSRSFARRSRATRTRSPPRSSTLTAYRLPGGAVLEGAIGQMKAILRGSEDNAIATFNASHRAIKDAIKRAVELDQALSEPCLHDLERARQAQATLWSFLRQEPDIADELRASATELDDLLNTTYLGRAGSRDAVTWDFVLVWRR